jgi:hypothetical protein
VAEVTDLTQIKLQDLKLATLAALVQAGIAMLEENPITPSEVESAIRRLARERDSERARAERYLAAMREWVETGDAAFEAAQRALIRPEDEPPAETVRDIENRAIRAGFKVLCRRERDTPAGSKVFRYSLEEAR